MSSDLWLQIDDLSNGPTLVGLVEEAVVGRDLRCDVVIHDDEALSRHRLADAPNGRLGDRRPGHQNGTFVNAQRIVGPAVLVIGDTIRIGRVSCSVGRVRQQSKNNTT